MKIVFLFGSGISIKAGMPSTQEVTNKVLNPYLKNYEVDKNLISKDFLDSLKNDKNYLDRIVLFIGCLKSYLDIYFFRDYKLINRTNYEDIFFFLDQMNQNKSG